MDLRASSPSTNTNRSSRSRQNSRTVHTYGWTPLVGYPYRAWGVAALPCRAKKATLWKGPSGKPSRWYSARLVVGDFEFGLSSHNRSSPLTLKISALALAASSLSASRWNRGVEDECRVRRLRGHAGHTANRRVAPRCPVQGTPDSRGSARPCASAQLPQCAPSDRSRARRNSSLRTTLTASPGPGGTNTSGSTRVTWTCAAYETSAGSVPSATRKASVSTGYPRIASARCRRCRRSVTDWPSDGRA